MPLLQHGGCLPQMFTKQFALSKELEKATLHLTALGVYVSEINGERVGEFVLAPGWTCYPKRLQYQTYDVTDLLKEENLLSVTVGKGWYRGRLPGWQGSKRQTELQKNPAAVLACLEISYTDGTTETIFSDDSWKVEESRIRFSGKYMTEKRTMHLSQRQKNSR